MDASRLASRFWPAAPSRVLTGYFLLLLVVSPIYASGQEAVIQRLLRGQCLEENQAVYTPARPRAGPTSGDCILFFAGSQDGSGDPEGTEALIRLGGLDVRLQLIRKTAHGPYVHYEFADRRTKTRVTMDVKSVCPQDVEGCDYAGSLTVNSDLGKSTVHVVYYRGT